MVQYMARLHGHVTLGIGLDVSVLSFCLFITIANYWWNKGLGLSMAHGMGNDGHDPYWYLQRLNDYYL